MEKPRDPLSDPLFKAAMRGSGYSTSDMQMITDLAKHASASALKRVMDIANTAPNEKMRGHILIGALATLQAEIDWQITELVKNLASGIGIDVGKL